MCKKCKKVYNPAAVYDKVNKNGHTHNGETIRGGDSNGSFSSHYGYSNGDDWRARSNAKPKVVTIR